MEICDLNTERTFSAEEHYHRVLATVADTDATIACWEPGQISPYHCHPHATEIYLCVEGGGRMRTAYESVDMGPGMFVVHPAGEIHEFINGSGRTVLFRVRSGEDRGSRVLARRGHPEWQQSAEDAEYFASDRRSSEVATIMRQLEADA